MLAVGVAVASSLNDGLVGTYGYMGINNNRSWYALVSPYNPTQYLAYIGQTWAFTDECLNNCPSDAILIESADTDVYTVTGAAWGDDEVTIHSDQKAPYICGVNVLFTDAAGGDQCDSYGLNGLYYDIGSAVNDHVKYYHEDNTKHLVYSELGFGMFSWEFLDSTTAIVRHSLGGQGTSTMFDVTELADDTSNWYYPGNDSDYCQKHSITTASCGRCSDDMPNGQSNREDFAITEFTCNNESLTCDESSGPSSCQANWKWLPTPPTCLENNADQIANMESIIAE
eukprot:733719_1